MSVQKYAQISLRMYKNKKYDEMQKSGGFNSLHKLIVGFWLYVLKSTLWVFVSSFLSDCSIIQCQCQKRHVKADFFLAPDFYQLSEWVFWRGWVWILDDRGGGGGGVDWMSNIKLACCNQENYVCWRKIIIFQHPLPYYFVRRLLDFFKIRNAPIDPCYRFQPWLTSMDEGGAGFLDSRPNIYVVS